jgi:glutamate dehydrogenase (NAD(P)+)
MNAAEACSQYFAEAAKAMEMSDSIASLLTTPLREVKIQIPIEMDSGEIRAFTGWWIQHDNARGPMQGGIRYHPSVDRDEMVALSSLMTWKAGVLNLPFGGSFGGVKCDPQTLSARELEQLTRKLVDQVQDIIGPSRDVPGPDVNTTPQIMAWVMDQYSRFHGHSPAVATGKPLDLYGSKGRDAAAGRGLLFVCREILRDIGMEVKGARFALQGFGKVGSQAARLLYEDGAKIVGVCDAKAGVSNPAGLEMPALFEHVKATGTIQGFGGGKSIAPQEVLVLDCDVLLPAALGGALDAKTASEVRAQLVVEGANGPTLPEADEAFEKRGIIVVPDILANAGGLTVSSFEWIQNLQQLAWEEDRVNAELEKTIKEGYERVVRLAKTRKLPLRRAAWVVAAGRVGKASMLRGF